MSARHLPYLATLYWVIPLVATITVWESLPKTATQLSLVIATGIIGMGATTRRIDYPIVGTPFFILLLASYSQQLLLINPILMSAVLIIALPLTAALLYRIGGRALSRHELIEHVFLGFLTAQVHSLLFYWPFSFFENALISYIAYYWLWQLQRILNAQTVRSVLAHFLFTALAVILVIGVLLWVNFPQLRIF